MAESRGSFVDWAEQHYTQSFPSNIHNPSHYTQGGVECIDALRSTMSKEQFRGFCRGNAIKYLWRYDHKGKPKEDLEKAKVYLEWLLETYRDE